MKPSESAKSPLSLGVTVLRKGGNTVDMKKLDISLALALIITGSMLVSNIFSSLLIGSIFGVSALFLLAFSQYYMRKRPYTADE